MGNLFADQYSLLHFSVGVIAYFWKISFANWFMIHIIFEILENSQPVMKFVNKYLVDKYYIWPGGKDKADSVINSIGDQTFAMLGWIFAYALDSYGEKKGWYKRHIQKTSGLL